MVFTMPTKTTVLSVLLCAAVFVACSSEEDNDGSTAGPVATGGSGMAGASGSSGAQGNDLPSVFAGFCTGVLTNATEYLLSTGPGEWIGGGKKVPAGTKFLVTRGFSTFGGILFIKGQAASLDADFVKGLVNDKDFTSTCASDNSKATYTLLMPATLYPDMALKGIACPLKQGTTFEGHSFFSGDVAEFSSEMLKSMCGFDKGYSKDLVAEDLIKL